MTRYIFYDPVDNLFYDEDHVKIGDIHVYLTPGDLLLFKEDWKNNKFPCKDDARINVEIFVKGGITMDNHNYAWTTNHKIEEVNIRMSMKIDTVGMTRDRFMEEFGDFTLKELQEKYRFAMWFDEPKVETVTLRKRRKK